MCRTRATLISLLLMLALPASAQNVPNDPNLIGHWTLDDGAGTIAKEATGKGLDGTVFGNPVWDKVGINGGCLLFDGVDDYIFIDGRWKLGQYTMSVWFRCDSPGQRDILSAYERGVLHGVLVELGADGRIRFLHRFPLGTGGGTSIYSTGNAGDGQWHHVAVTKAKTEIVLYLDGVKAASGADSSVFNPTDYFSLCVGQLDNERLPMARLWIGAIDDICIYDRALTPAELKPLGFRGKAHDRKPHRRSYGRRHPTHAMESGHRCPVPQRLRRNEPGARPGQPRRHQARARPCIGTSPDSIRASPTTGASMRFWRTGRPSRATCGGSPPCP